MLGVAEFFLNVTKFQDMFSFLPYVQKKCPSSFWQKKLVTIIFLMERKWRYPLKFSLLYFLAFSIYELFRTLNQTIQFINKFKLTSYLLSYVQLISYGKAKKQCKLLYSALISITMKWYQLSNLQEVIISHSIHIITKNSKFARCRLKCPLLNVISNEIMT